MKRTIIGAVVGLVLGLSIPTFAYEEANPCVASATFQPHTLKERVRSLELRVRRLETCS